MKLKFEIFLFLFGLILFAVAQSDLISIMASLFNTVFNTSLPVSFLQSFFFRIIILLIGSFLIFIACYSYHYRNKKEA